MLDPPNKTKKDKHTNVHKHKAGFIMFTRTMFKMFTITMYKMFTSTHMTHKICLINHKNIHTNFTITESIMNISLIVIISCGKVIPYTYSWKLITTFSFSYRTAYICLTT